MYLCCLNLAFVPYCVFPMALKASCLDLHQRFLSFSNFSNQLSDLKTHSATPLLLHFGNQSLF